MRRKSRHRFRRLSIEVSEPVNDRLEHLMDVTGARTVIEIVSIAVSLLDRLVGEDAAGSDVVVRRPDGRELVVLLPFPRPTRHDAPTGQPLPKGAA